MPPDRSGLLAVTPGLEWLRCLIMAQQFQA
jgi:hypothetical protein